ncbi:MAG: plastocyanin/azurin family copper-binding protein [Dehalococcoidia bacterium]
MATATATATAPPPAPTATAAPTAAPTTAPTAAPTAAPLAPIAVSTSISDFAFETPLTVAVGSTLTWTNADGAPHTVTATEGSFDSGSIVASGSFAHTFSVRGTFAYFCQIHPFMTGSVTVQ